VDGILEASRMARNDPAAKRILQSARAKRRLLRQLVGQRSGRASDTTEYA
jgi:hypothetical protein